MADRKALETDFLRLSEDYAGRWVAINPQTRQVVASGETAVEVYEAARQAGIEEPFITFVVNNYGAYVTCLK